MGARYTTHGLLETWSVVIDLCTLFHLYFFSVDISEFGRNRICLYRHFSLFFQIVIVKIALFSLTGFSSGVLLA